MRCLYLLLVLCGLLSCKNTLREEVKNSSSLYYLEIDKPNFNSLKPLLLSEFVDSIEYLQLEATEDCLLPYDGYPGMSEVGDFLFINDLFTMLQFDTNTGEFLCQIGRKGQGPGEYEQVNGSIDKDNNIVYVKSPNKVSSLLSYNFNGEYMGDLPLEDTENFSFSNCFYSLKLVFINNKYAIFTSEVLPKERTCHPYQLIVYDHKNKKMKHTLNNQMEPIPNFRYYNSMNGMYIFLNYEDLFYYKSFYNDTLYSVHLEKGIEPYAIIDLGKRKYPIEALFGSLNNIGKVGKIMINNTYINHSFIILECMLMDDESLRNTSWFLYKFDLHTRMSTYHSPYLLNDLDGGDNTGLTGLSRKIIPVKRLDMDLSEFEKKMFFSNLKKSELKYPELKDKYDVMQSKRDPDDNPLLMKLHLKKD